MRFPARRVTLASASPRRAALLRQAGVDFDVEPADIDETPAHGERPEDYVARLSVAKAEAVAARAEDAIVVAADTTIDLDGAIVGQPGDGADAHRILRLLSGRRHVVHTGVTVRGDDRSTTIVVTTAVTFVELDDATIESYVATGEPFGKAGAYAIQGGGGAFVARVDGSVTNVVGLPLAETLALLRAAGWPRPPIR